MALRGRMTLAAAIEFDRTNMSKPIHRSRHQRKSVLAGASSLLTTPAAIGASWIAYSAFFINHSVPIDKAIHAEWSTFLGEHSGLLTYYLDRHESGRPLVLVHSINAAGSSYEMRPLFEHYQHTRPIFALDLPGFGFSERSDRPYTSLLYANAILDFLQSEVGEPADVVTLSLSSEFAAWAALAEPERFHSLTMISPTGFTARTQTSGSARAAQKRKSDNLYRLFAFPLWGQGFYDLIATRPSIDYFLQKNFVGPIDPGLADYAYATSHQSGARYAPLYFVSGKLFTRDIVSRVYDRLMLPVLVLYDRDAFVRFDTLPEFVDAHSNWRRVQIVPSNGLPQFERLPETVDALDRFWIDCSQPAPAV